MIKKLIKYRTLAIVGNGFDLRHGYNTRYSDFAKTVEDNESIRYYRKFCDKNTYIGTWYEFEKNIGDICLDLWKEYHVTGDDNSVEYQNYMRLIESFGEIKKLMVDYLKRETEEKIFVPLDFSVSKYLGTNTVALDFNYTSTLEHYMDKDNIIYVHGSLDENSIILGYESRDEPCLTQHGDMIWQKNIGREILYFERYLKNCTYIENNLKLYDEIINDLQVYLKLSYSSRGLEESDLLEIPKGYFIAVIMDYLQNGGLFIPMIDYSCVEELVVLGHGIQADEEYLAEVLGRCVSLRRIIIFSYCGENKQEFQKKVGSIIEKVPIKRSIEIIKGSY